MSSVYFLNHEVHKGREEKPEEMPGTAGPDFYNTSSSLRAHRDLRGAARLQPKAERPEKSDTMRIDRG